LPQNISQTYPLSFIIIFMEGPVPEFRLKTSACFYGKYAHSLASTDRGEENGKQGDDMGGGDFHLLLCPIRA